MITHKLPYGWTIKVPETYHPVPLKGFKEWVEALESGKYRKGINKLCTSQSPEIDLQRDDFCCLGVRCHLAGRLEYRKERSAWLNGKYAGCIDEEDPDYPALQTTGTFPQGIVAYNPNGVPSNSLAVVNDATSDFAVVIAIIKLLWRRTD